MTTVRWSPRETMSRWTIRFQTPEEYYALIPQQHIWSNWAMEPVVSWQQNGPMIYNDYPWLVHNHARYRYNPRETCRYDLIDRELWGPDVGWGDGPCDITYNQCADQRDRANWNARSERFFCAERVGTRFRNDGRTAFSWLPTPPDRDYAGGARQPTIERRDDRRDDIRREEAPRANGRDAVRYGAWNNYGRSGYYGGPRTFRTYPEVFNAAKAGQLNGCGVKRAGFNLGGCDWKAEVMGRHYPFNQNDVCGAPRRAGRVGCNISNSEAENVGCLLAMAIDQGYCR